MNGSQTTLDMVLDRVATNNFEWLTWARGFAQSFSLTHGRVTSDDVRDACEKYGLKPMSEKAYGSIFRGKGWRCIGFEPSRIKSNHSRRLCVWQWTPTQEA